MEKLERLQVIEEKNAEQKLNDGTPQSELTLSILNSAFDSGASDIHIEAQDSGYRVRFRVLGELVLWRDLKAQVGTGVKQTIKKISTMDTSQNDIPQDGAFELTKDSKKYRLRVALSPTSQGESIVMRVIDNAKSPSLENLGFANDFTYKLKEVSKKSKGLVIITGPTGSGKSSTLQSLIEEINIISKKVISIEDPVEKKIEGIIQKQITYQNTWAESIKMSLREDPDVIFIGEIRDNESAKLAIEAAQTGHLVFTTLHTNNAMEVYERMHTLGVDEEKFKASVLMITAQRLAKTLCDNCKQSGEKHLIRGNGCEKCTGKGMPHGIGGRYPIAEYIYKQKGEMVTATTLDKEAKELLNKGRIDLEEYHLWSEL